MTKRNIHVTVTKDKENQRIFETESGAFLAFIT